VRVDVVRLRLRALFSYTILDESITFVVFSYNRYVCYIVYLRNQPNNALVTGIVGDADFSFDWNSFKRKLLLRHTKELLIEIEIITEVEHKLHPTLNICSIGYLSNGNCHPVHSSATYGWFQEITTAQSKKLRILT